MRVLERNTSDGVNPTILIQFGSLYLTRLTKITADQNFRDTMQGWQSDDSQMTHTSFVAVVLLVGFLPLSVSKPPVSPGKQTIPCENHRDCENCIGANVLVWQHTNTRIRRILCKLNIFDQYVANMQDHLPAAGQKFCVWCNSPNVVSPSGVSTTPKCLAVKNLNPSSCPNLKFNFESCTSKNNLKN